MKNDNGLCLSQPSGFSFGLEESKDVSLSDWSLHISDDLARGLSEELNLDLGALTLRSGTSQNLDHACQSNLLVHLKVGVLCE